MPDARRWGWLTLAVFSVFIALSIGGLAAAAVRVAMDAVWRPDPGFINRFHAECDRFGGKQFTGCFLAAMARAGASPTALEFSRRLDGEAYLAELQVDGGPIAVAHVFYPFRANENDTWLLVNGAPSLIDVDDQRHLALDRMKAALPYREIERHFPQVTFWPGDRGNAGPKVRMAGQQFVVGYVLRNVCHACATVGRVSFAFNFDHSGKFLGTRLVSVVPAGR